MRDSSDEPHKIYYFWNAKRDEIFVHSMFINYC